MGSSAVAAWDWRQCYILYVVSFVDLFAVSMIIPSLSSYVRTLNGDAMTFGMVMSLYGAIQFFSSPMAGSLSDVYGRRQVLLWCIAGAAVGYLLLALSWNIYVVVLSRIPAAMFKHTLDLIRVALTDQQEPKRRAAVVGRLNACSNAGFILGPVIGGYISAFPRGFNYTSLVTTLLFGVNFILIACFFHDSTLPTPGCKDHGDKDESVVTPTSTGKSKKDRVTWQAIGGKAWNKLLELRVVFLQDDGTNRAAKVLLFARLLMAMAAILHRTHFTTILQDKFHADSKTRGFILSYMGCLGATSSFLVGFLTSCFGSELGLLQLASGCYVLTFIALTQVQSLRSVYILLVPQILSVR